MRVNTMPFLLVLALALAGSVGMAQENICQIPEGRSGRPGSALEGHK
jgi:hypothetical protein